MKVDGKKGRTIAKKVAEEYEATAPEKEIPLGLAGKIATLATMAKITLTPPTNEAAMLVLCNRYRIADDQGEVGTLIALAKKAMERSAEDRMVVDFDDQLWFPHEFSLQPWKHDLVIVDEAQDMNASQLELARKSVKRGGRLVAVGDDRQCQPPGTRISVPGGKTVEIENLRDGDAVVAWDCRSKALVGREKAANRVRVAFDYYEGELIEVRADGTET